MDESCIEQHKNERRVRTLDEDDDLLSSQGGEPSLSGDTDLASVNDNNDDVDEGQSPDVSDNSDSEDSPPDELEDVDASDEDTGDNVSASLNQLTDSVRDIKMQAVNQSAEGQLPAGRTVDDAADQEVFPDTSIRLKYVGGDK